MSKHTERAKELRSEVVDVRELSNSVKMAVDEIEEKLDIKSKKMKRQWLRLKRKFVLNSYI